MLFSQKHLGNSQGAFFVPILICLQLTTGGKSMKPILFPEGQTNFTTNGIGRLPDAISLLFDRVLSEERGEHRQRISAGQIWCNSVHWRTFEKGYIIYNTNIFMYTVFRKRHKLCHSLGRPSFSDLVQFLIKCLIR